MRCPPFRRVLVSFALVLGCASSPAPAPATEPTSPRVATRYVANVPPPVAASGDVEAEALLGAGVFLERHLVRSGGAQRDSASSGLPAYVFNVSVEQMLAEASGRTRASVTTTVSTEEDGRIVGMLRATATAFVERDAPLAERQQRAIEGALEGSLRNLPELLDRLDLPR